MSDEVVVDIGAAKANGKRPRKAKSRDRQPSGDWRDGLCFSRRTGTIEKTVANVITILGNAEEWARIFQWDEFGQIIVATRVPPWDEHDAPFNAKPGEWSDSDTIRAQAWLARHYSLKVGSETVYDAVKVVAERSVINPPKNWLEALRWDGTRRVNGWLASYLGVAPSAYVTNVGRFMLVSAVARVMKPGCKVDTMLVLEGPQGIRKSTAFRVLFSDKWFSDTPLDLNSKDRFVALRNNWCHEVAELDAFGRAEIARVKSFLSSQTDDFRPPYGKSNRKVERRCIFVGTVNDSEYLRDPTGNRRFHPVRCGKISIAALERDRDQIMAEAREMFLSGEKWWPDGGEVRACEDAQAERATHDVWLEIISAYVEKERLRLGDEDTFLTIGDILAGAICIEKGKWSQSDQNRVARCLLQLGWEPAHRRRKSSDGRSRPVHGYVPVSRVELEPVTEPVTEVSE